MRASTWRRQFSVILIAIDRLSSNGAPYRPFGSLSASYEIDLIQAQVSTPVGVQCRLCDDGDLSLHQIYLVVLLDICSSVKHLPTSSITSVISAFAYSLIEVGISSLIRRLQAVKA